MTRATERAPKPPMILKGRTDLGVDVYEAARARVHHVYDTYDSISVGFSGGKDSTCVLHVALDVARERGELPLRVIFWDEEAIPLETERYVRRVIARHDGEIALEWYCIPVKHRNGCAPGIGAWVTWNPLERDRWVRPLPPEAITHVDGLPVPTEDDPLHALSIPDSSGLLFGRERGRCAHLMGIRAAESLIRTAAVMRRTHENYIITIDRAICPTLQTSFVKAYPIYDWTTNDVWTAPARYGWDYNEAYDLMEMAGITLHRQRIAPPYGEEPMQLLWMFKTCFPDVWDRMSCRVPGASTAARYATSQLYSFGEVPPKPPDVTWREHIHDLVGRHADGTRAHVIKMVRKWIKVHSFHTADPILPIARHPETGVSWHALLAIAARGDLKERKQLYVGSDLDRRARFREAYDAERADLESQLGRPLTFDETGDMC